MRQTLIGGALLAIAIALLVVLGEAFGLDLQHIALLGALLGAVLGLIPDRSSGERLLGFGVGFVVAWIGYLLRAALFPDTPTGRAVAAFIIVGVCVGIATIVVGRFSLPLWSLFVGVAAMVGAYEETYTAMPTRVLEESPSAATAVLLAAAVGFFVTAISNIPFGVPSPRGRRKPTATPSAGAVDADSSLEDMFSSKGTPQ